MEAINATWPHSQHRLNNSAADTTPPQAYLDYCFFSHLPRTLDLVILEFGSMGASASFSGVEALMRVLLSLRPRPHLAFFTVREWCKASVKPWGSAPPYGPADVTKHVKAEAAFTGLCAHYNQSCISYHHALAPHFYAKEHNFSMLDIAGDCLHPNRGRLGNDYVTDLLVYWLATAVRRVTAAAAAGSGETSDAGLAASPPDLLPPPLFDSGRVLTAQGLTRNERCYGFSGLGGRGRQRYQRLLSVPWHTAYCPQMAGCTCPAQRIDAHWPNASLAGAMATHRFVVRGGSTACVVRLRVLDASSSGGHGFKVRQLTITDEHNSPRTTRGTDATPPTTATVLSSTVAYSAAARRAKRVARKQREMIKGSYK